jgi:acyl carrier protein phosphodiesterase
MATGVAMAKKRAVKPSASDAPLRVEYVQVRMTAAFKEWLQSYADDRNLSITDALIQGVIEDAAKRGFRKAPKR